MIAANTASRTVTSWSELLFGPEILVHHHCGDAGVAGDLAHADAVVTSAGEVLNRRLQDRLTGCGRTDWMGSSMTMREPGPDYRDALGFMHELRRSTNGSQTGDLARAARIIIDVVEAPDPPRRLLLGSDTVEMALDNGIEHNEEDRQWAAVSRSADFSE